MPHLGSTLSKVPMSSQGSTLRPLIQLKGPTQQSVVIGMAEVTVDLNRVVEAQVRDMAVSVSILKMLPTKMNQKHNCYHSFT